MKFITKWLKKAGSVIKNIFDREDVQKLVEVTVKESIEAVKQEFSDGLQKEDFARIAGRVYEAGLAHKADWFKALESMGAEEAQKWLASGPLRELKRYAVYARVAEKLVEQSGALPPLATAALNLIIETVFSEGNQAAAIPVIA